MKSKISILAVLLLGMSTLPASALDVMPPNESFIYAFDQNRDGKLNLKEFLSIKKSPDGVLVWDFPINRASFKMLDKNRNGYLEQKDALPIRFTDEFNDCISRWPSCSP